MSVAFADAFDFRSMQRIDLRAALMLLLLAHAPRQRRERMLHVDDLIEPGAEQILLSRLPPFPWLHLVPRRSLRLENHRSSLQPLHADSIPGKLDYPSMPFPDSKSTTWEFITDD